MEPPSYRIEDYVNLYCLEHALAYLC